MRTRADRHAELLFFHLGLEQGVPKTFSSHRSHSTSVATLWGAIKEPQPDVADKGEGFASVGES